MRDGAKSMPTAGRFCEICEICGCSELETNIVRYCIALALLLALVACSAGSEPADPAARGERLYTTFCLGCHGVTPDAADTLGPNLAKVAGRAAANPGGLSAADWLRRATVNPGAEIAPGYNPGLMPENYGEQFSAAELDALVAYMLTLE